MQPTNQDGLKIIEVHVILKANDYMLRTEPSLLHYSEIFSDTLTFPSQMHRIGCGKEHIQI